MVLAGERTLLGQLASSPTLSSRLLGHFRGLVGPLVLRTPATDLAFVDDLLLGLDDLGPPPIFFVPRPLWSWVCCFSSLVRVVP